MRNKHIARSCEEKAAQTTAMQERKMRLRYFCRRRCCCFCCWRYCITGRCPIHFCVLSACNWQPNNNNQSFGKMCCAVCAACALRNFQTSHSILHNKYSIQLYSSILIPNFTRLPYETKTMPMHFERGRITAQCLYIIRVIALATGF